MEQRRALVGPHGGELVGEQEAQAERDRGLARAVVAHDDGVAGAEAERRRLQVRAEARQRDPPDVH